MKKAAALTIALLALSTAGPRWSRAAEPETADKESAAEKALDAREDDAAAIEGRDGAALILDDEKAVRELDEKDVDDKEAAEKEADDTAVGGVDEKDVGDKEAAQEDADGKAASDLDEKDVDQDEKEVSGDERDAKEMDRDAEHETESEADVKAEKIEKVENVESGN